MSVIIDGIIGSIVRLFILVTAAVVPSVSVSNNCVDIDCFREKLEREKLERICKEGTAPPYLDCENILRCNNDEWPRLNGGYWVIIMLIALSLTKTGKIV
jgi:hypothetical protein